MIALLILTVITIVVFPFSGATDETGKRGDDDPNHERGRPATTTRRERASADASTQHERVCAPPQPARSRAQIEAIR